MATTWNPSDTDSHITMSGGNLIATGITGISAWKSCRSTTSKSSGKFYFEVAVHQVSARISVGIANATAALTNYAGIDTNGVSAFQDLGIFYNGSNALSGSWLTASSVVIGVAVDFTNKLFWIKANLQGTPTNWNLTASATPNPATGTSGFSYGSTGAMFAAVSLQTVGDTATVNFGASTYVGTVPSGFTSWDPTGVARPIAEAVFPTSLLAAALARTGNISAANIPVSLLVAGLHKHGVLSEALVPTSAIVAPVLKKGKDLAEAIIPVSALTASIARRRALVEAITPVSVLVARTRTLQADLASTSLLTAALARSRALTENVAPVSLLNCFPNIAIGMTEAVRPASALVCAVARSRSLREAIRPSALPAASLGRSTPLVPNPITPLSAVALTRAGGGQTRPFLVVLD